MALKQFQKNLLQKCINLETQDINICGENTLQTNIGILCNNVGSGKSFIVLALILQKHKLNYEQVFNFISTVSLHIKKTFIETNIIIIHNAVTIQWESYIKQFDLKFKIIENKNDLFINFSDFDIVLVTCTCYNEFAKLSEKRSLIFKRVFYDDVDYLNIARSYDIKCAFQWFISSTLYNLSHPHGKQVYLDTISQYINIIPGIKCTGYIREVFSSLTNHENILQYITVSENCIIEDEFGIEPYEEKTIICKSPIMLYILESSISSEIVRCINANDIESALHLIHPKNKSSEDNIINACIEKLSLRLQNINFQINNCQSMPLKKKLTILENLNDKKKDINAQISNIRERVIQTNTCPICFDNIIHDKSIMHGCCSNAFCFKCIFQWIALNNTCPLCKVQIKLNDIMIVNEENILENDTSSVIHEDNDKMKNLINIIRSGPNKKILLFSEFKKTFETISDLFLNDKSITFTYLKGNMKSKIKKFKSNGTSVFFVNQNFNGSGMNLVEATDIIFFHKFNDEIEKLIIGRAQRYGRKTRLKIWYLLHKNEINS